MRINQHEGGIDSDQITYVNDILSRFGMAIGTPSDISTKLSVGPVWNRGPVFLGTALIKSKTKHGEYVILRALIDEGSQSTFATERAAQLVR